MKNITLSADGHLIEVARERARRELTAAAVKAVGCSALLGTYHDGDRWDQTRSVWISLSLDIPHLLVW